MPAVAIGAANNQTTIIVIIGPPSLSKTINPTITRRQR